MKTIKSMILGALAVVGAWCASAVEPQAWFDTQIGFYTEWPTNNAALYGGMWTNEEGATLESGALVVDADAEAPLTFAATDAKTLVGSGESAVAVTARAKFHPVASAGELPAMGEAKAALAVVAEGGDVLRYYGLAKDGTTNAWVRLSDTVDAVTNDFVDVTVSVEGSNVCYQVGTLNVTNEVVLASDTVSTVGLSGSGTLAALSATSRLVTSVVTPQAVANASYKVSTNEVEVASPFEVLRNAEVKVVYTANPGYVFAGGSTVAAVFTANAAEVQVPAEKLPTAPLKLTGVTVNGADAILSPGDGWIFADGVLSLTNEQVYTLSGTNAEGAVRVDVTTNATVRLENISLSGLTTTNAITFASGATNATLTLIGTNEVMVQGFASVKVASGAKLTLSSDGVLVGNAILDVANGGTADVYAGVFGSDSTAPFLAESGADLTVFGGVYDVAPEAELIASGFAATQVGDLYVVGTNVTYDTNNKLTGGTYTFCPTNAAYVAAGVMVKGTVRIEKQETEPTTWLLYDVSILAKPTQVAHATAAVYTNGVLSAETSSGSGQWYACSNETAKVVYTADVGYVFAGGATVVTNNLNTAVNPAVNVTNPPEVLAHVEYVDEKGKTQTTNAIVIASSGSRVTWSEGWYVVDANVTIAGGADVEGAVKLILADGAKLTINDVGQDNAGIGVSGDGNSFAIYGQAGCEGKLEVEGGNGGAGIGGGNGASASTGYNGVGSHITINGGNVFVTGGQFGAGIGGGYTGRGFDITINGGEVEANGGFRGAGIGGGTSGRCNGITINGGLVSAYGSFDGAGIGCGDDGFYPGWVYDICVADEIILEAGPSDTQLEVIPHESPETDVALSLAGKTCASAKGPVRASNWNQVFDHLRWGNRVRLVKNVTQGYADSGVTIDGKTATLDLNGFTITGSGCQDVQCRPLTLRNGANLTLTDSSAAKTGAIDGLGTVRDVNGGCVYVDSGCVFTMTGGTITNCVAAHGGGIYSKGRLTMIGGVLVGNQSTDDSASTAIYSCMDDGDAIYGGVIGGTIYREAVGDLSISGGVFDRDQTSLLVFDKTCTQVGEKWIVGTSIAYDASAKLTGGTYTFCPTNAEYVAAAVADPTKVTVTASGSTYTLTAKGSVDSDTWAQVKSNLEADNRVRLVKNVTQDAPGAGINGKTVTLDLNGFTITGSGWEAGAGRLLMLMNGANLTLTDGSDAKTGAIDGLCVKRDVYGGCVYVNPDCTFTMNSGTITNFVAVQGGAVYNGGAFVLNGGTITGNTSTEYGGGVFVASGATMAFSGGEISCNTANSTDIGGGGIVSSGRLTMTGGTISGNVSGKADATAIYSNMDDGDAICGGVIDGTICRADDGDLVISGGVFDRNQTALASGYTCTQVGSNWIVGNGVMFNADNRLTGGTYTFCPTNALYVAAGLSVRETVKIEERATEPKTWTLCDMAILAVPTPVVHATAAVYTNGVLSAETSSGSGQWYAWTNETATVVYTADAGRCFEGGATAVTNALDTAVNPAVNAVSPPEVLPQVTYVDEWGEIRTANAQTVVASVSRVTWNTGWYAVTNDVTISRGADVNGAVKLILADGAKLTINDVETWRAGIGITDSSRSFAVYGQVGGTGKLAVSGGSYGAGIGGGRNGSGVNITINGGAVTAWGGFDGAGIGGGQWGSGENITINGGTVTATGGGNSGAGIGGSYQSPGKNITINGGTVTATGARNAAGIGGGEWRGGENITINGGMVTATGGENASGIGGGQGGTFSGIYVANDVIIKADSSANPTEAIPHASPTTDIASSLAGKRYATVEMIVAYPDYLAKYGPAVTNRFTAWATTFGSRDPDGVYTNAFLLNVATNNQTAAEEAFAIGSIAVTNGVVDVELPKPLAPATSFNGDVWLQCVTNLPAADWKDVESGRYVDEKGSFLRCLIDFEHTLTPGTFPTDPEGTKTIKVLAR